MSHQVGLVWQGGNGWDDMVREQLEESTIRQRLGGRRDSAAQIGTPPSTSPPPGAQRRRRSSLAQLTDILREWSGGSSKRNNKPPLNRRETLADLARSLPWGKTSTDATVQFNNSHAPQLRKRRESSADSGIRSMRSRRESHASDLAKLWNKRESPGDRERDRDRERERREQQKERDREREIEREREKEDTGPSTDPPSTRNV